MLELELYDGFVGLGLKLLALSTQIPNRKHGEVGSMWSYGAWSKQDCWQSRHSSLEEMGRNVWEALIYQILLEVSVTAAPKSPQVMSQALPHSEVHQFSIRAWIPVGIQFLGWRWDRMGIWNIALWSFDGKVPQRKPLSAKRRSNFLYGTALQCPILAHTFYGE